MSAAPSNDSRRSGGLGLSSVHAPILWAIVPSTSGVVSGVPWPSTVRWPVNEGRAPTSARLPVFESQEPCSSTSASFAAKSLTQENSTFSAREKYFIRRGQRNGGNNLKYMLTKPKSAKMHHPHVHHEAA
jgi:hypothetical protein